VPPASPFFPLLAFFYIFFIQPSYQNPNILALSHQIHIVQNYFVKSGSNDQQKYE